MMYTKEELNEMLETCFDEYTSEELAYQLTAYERGYIAYENGIIDLYVKPYLEGLDTSELVSKFNDFCSESNYFEDMIETFDEEFFEVNFSSAYEAARATFFGKINSWADTYIKFNGRGNLESFNDCDVEYQIMDNGDFIQWVYENDDEFEVFRDEGFKADIIRMTIELVAQGY